MKYAKDTFELRAAQKMGVIGCIIECQDGRCSDFGGFNGHTSEDAVYWIALH